MADYSFLTSLTLIDTGRRRQPKEKLPTGMRVRIYSDGSVYPSKELMDAFKLEYVKKAKEEEKEEESFGFDIFDSQEWAPLAQHPRMIVFGLVPKNAPKVDLFAACRYNDQGEPRASVLTQGTVSTTLLDLVRQIGYLSPEQKYADLEVLTEFHINVKDGIAYIPKVVERGEKKGEKTYVRRENALFYPVDIPENLENKEVKKVEEEKATPTTLVTNNS